MMQTFVDDSSIDGDYRLVSLTVDRTLALLCIHDATDTLQLLEISD